MIDNFYGERLAAAAKHADSPLCKRINEAIAAVKTAQRAVSDLADARSFRGDMVAVHGPDAARDIVEDWKASSWTLSQVYGVLGTTAVPTSEQA